MLREECPGHITRDTCLVKKQAQYSAFGEELQRTGAAVTRFGYQGTAWMRLDSGLLLSPTRLYLPREGRFGQEDLISSILVRGSLGQFATATIAAHLPIPISTQQSPLDDVALSYATAVRVINGVGWELDLDSGHPTHPGTPYGLAAGSPAWLVDPSGLAYKFCGVKSFTVTWEALPPKGGLDLGWHISVKAEFKKDSLHDPCCCEYEQRVKAEIKVGWGDPKKPQTHTERWPWKDDGYSRSPEYDAKKRGYESCEFETNDYPGYHNRSVHPRYKGKIKPGRRLSMDLWVYYFEFVAQQTIYSPPPPEVLKDKGITCHEQDVAQIGPIHGFIKARPRDKVKHSIRGAKANLKPPQTFSWPGRPKA